MIFRVEKLLFKLVSVAVFVAACLAFSTDANAQSRKSAKEKASDKKETAKLKKPTKAELARQAEIARRQEVAREEAEERRQAALEAQRRREQAAREAHQRQLNFEHGLKDETLANISNDNSDGEDLEVRRAAINALSGHAGTVVVMEPQTGKILSIVNQDWGIRKGFKPCSTIKLVTATAGINEGVIGADGSIETRSFPMGLNDALAFSNNKYFQTVGTTGLGNQKMISYARSLGLGEPTGINALNEAAGKLPYGNSNAKIYSHGDDFEVTPLQLAVVVSAISNGGKIVVPQIPRVSYGQAAFRGQMKREVNVLHSTLQEILPGMVGAVNYGTARRSGANAFAAAGKTGSCIGQGSWLGLFASVAPVVNPQLAVVVVTRGSGERGKYASVVAGKVYQALAYRLRENGAITQPLVAKLPETLKPHPQINPKAAAAMDSEDEDSDEDGDVSATTAASRPNPKKGGDDAAKNVARGGNPSIAANHKQTAQPSYEFGTTVIRVGQKATDQPARKGSRPRVVMMENK